MQLDSPQQLVEKLRALHSMKRQIRALRDTLANERIHVEAMA
jgi:hypothetical protein